MTVYRCGIVRMGWHRNRIEIGISRNRRLAGTVSGAVCRRFESCQARLVFLPEIVGFSDAFVVVLLTLPMALTVNRRKNDQKTRQR
jgi:hypothetical protein